MKQITLKMSSTVNPSPKAVPDDRVGFVLRDGTSLRDLIDVEKREVSLRVLTDPELYQLELERLFARAWIGVAHESEIPNPGDFVLRSMGEDSVIVTRGSDGRIDVLLNVCSHRGMQVCRTDSGTATSFRCPYHGWVFGQDGRYLGAPFEREMYGDTLDKPALGLSRARVGTYAGIVFATWDAGAPSLEDYLGDIKWYLDVMFRRTDAGLEVVGLPQRFIVRANWKCASEQWAGDGYHGATLHRSIEELGLGKSASLEVLVGINVSTPQGHGLRCINLKKVITALFGADAGAKSIRDKLRLVPPSGLTPEMVDQVERHLDEEQLRAMADTPPGVGQLFPNFFVWNIPGFASDGGPPVGFGRFHTTIPRGPECFEMISWTLVEKDAPDALKERARMISTINMGVSGFVEQDDAEAWPSLQRSAKGVMGRQKTLKYGSLLGVHKPADWGGPGLVYDGMSKDDNQWNWWLRYREFMTGRAW